MKSFLRKILPLVGVEVPEAPLEELGVPELTQTLLVALSPRLEKLKERIIAAGDFAMKEHFTCEDLIGLQCIGFETLYKVETALGKKNWNLHRDDAIQAKPLLYKGFTISMKV